MDEATAIAEVLAGVHDVTPDYDAMEVMVDAIHLRQLRRACGCPNCRAHLEADP